MIDRWENFPERCQDCYWLSVMGVDSTGAWFDCYAYVNHPPKEDGPPCLYYRQRTKEKYQSRAWDEFYREQKAKMAKVEFIESYNKIDGGDYQWSDNHGELIRCENCKHWIALPPHCEKTGRKKYANGYCDEAEKREE